jgi:hypothetical protein
MKLYEVPKNTKVRLLEGFRAPYSPDPGMVVTFDHIDGMYSYCVTDAGEVVHPAAWTEVEIVE